MVIKRIKTLSKGKINWMTILKTWRVRRENQWREKNKISFVAKLEVYWSQGLPNDEEEFQGIL
jgi:hypothetical protein